MKRTWLAGLILAAAWPMSAWGVIGTADNVPGATLLIPYFELDAGSPGRLETVVEIVNSGPAPTLAWVNLWTDLGIPTLGFYVYLTGYDVESFSLSTILLSSTLSVNPGPCTNPTITPSLRDHLQAAHAGQPSPATGLCYASGSNGLQTGYITVDAMPFSGPCTGLTPVDNGYFDLGGTGAASNDNVLLGGWYLIDTSNNFMISERAVSIEASATDPLTDGAGDYTFYANLPSVDGQGLDNRERLSGDWAFPFVAQRAFLNVWRDPGGVPAPFTCGGGLPAPFPLGHDQDVVVNTELDTTSLAGPIPVGLATSLDANGLGSYLPADAKQGWIYLDLNTDWVGAPIRNLRQAWVTLMIRASGQYSSGFSAVAVDGAPPFARPASGRQEDRR